MSDNVLQPPQSPLHAILLKSFTEAFGEPHKVAENERQWSLRALNYIAALNVLVSPGASHRDATPVVWIFDPHDPSNGISNTLVTREEDVAPLIEKIKARVRERSQPPAPHK
jgi:hypothetical protein